MKRISIYLLCATMLMLFLVGCGNNGNSNSKEETTSLGETVLIEDVEWAIKEGIIDGERGVVLNYSNNSDYTITSFEISFKEKSDISDEEKNTFYNDIQNDYQLTSEDMEELKKEPISMRAESEKIVAPGKSNMNIMCYYYDGYYGVEKMDHYKLLTPDIATIKYLDNDIIYTEFYDFNSKEYSVDSETEMANYWPSTEISGKIPKPEGKIMITNYADTESFGFDVYDISVKEYAAYIEECKTLGYTVNANELIGSSSYDADNNEGYHVYVHYDEEACSMSIRVEGPESEEE